MRSSLTTGRQQTSKSRVSLDMEAAAYVDPNTIRRKGDVVKMWYLFDYNTARSDLRGSYLSQKAQVQFDCAEERIRVLASILKCRPHPVS